MNPQEYAKELIDRLNQRECAEIAAEQEREASALRNIAHRAGECLALAYAKYPALAQFATCITQHKPTEDRYFTITLPGYWPITFSVDWRPASNAGNGQEEYFAVLVFNVFKDDYLDAQAYVTRDCPLEFALAFALRAAWKGNQE